MKKIKTMRAAGGLLIATLLTTSAVSGTYAKYVSGGSAGDTARVAKWGIVIAASGNLFSSSYLGADDNTPASATAEAKAISVKSYNDDAVVAPGTKSDQGMYFNISGTPEVDYKLSGSIEGKDVYLATGTYALMVPVKVDASTFDTLKDTLYTGTAGTSYTKLTDDAVFDSDIAYFQLNTVATVGDDGYYPVVFSGASKTTAKEIVADWALAFGSDAIALDSSNKTGSVKYVFDDEYVYKNNTSISADLNAQTLSWEWAFYKDADTDLMDTILGDLAALYKEDATFTTDIVSVDDNDAVTILTVDSNGLVLEGDDEVGCVVETLNIDLTATQVD